MGCLEIAAAEGVKPLEFDTDLTLRHVREVLWGELGPGGAAVSAMSDSLQPEAAARLRTRIRALLTEVVGAH